MILVNHYAIWPPIPKTVFIKLCWVKIIARPFVLFHNDRFFSMSTAFSINDSLMHICLNSSSCHNVLILLSLSGVTTLSLLVGVCAAWMLACYCNTSSYFDCWNLPKLARGYINMPAHKHWRLFLGLISYMGIPKPFSIFCGYFFKKTHFCG